MVYGIGAKALGEQLSVDEDEAAVFMETFKAKYPGTDIVTLRNLGVLRKSSSSTTAMHFLCHTIHFRDSFRR